MLELASVLELNWHSSGLSCCEIALKALSLKCEERWEVRLILSDGEGLWTL